MGGGHILAQSHTAHTLLGRGKLENMHNFKDLWNESHFSLHLGAPRRNSLTGSIAVALVNA